MKKVQEEAYGNLLISKLIKSEMNLIVYNFKLGFRL